jgi:hypothetical protein
MYRYTLEKRVFIVRERTGKDFPKYGVPGSILSGSKWWTLPAHVMMSHFSHNERTLIKFCCNIIFGVRIIKEMPGLVGSGTPCPTTYIYNQDATLHSLYYLETALHVSGGTTTHHQER